MKNIIIVLVITFTYNLALHAGGPWAKGKGKSYIKLSEWWTVFDQHYTDKGLLDPNVTTGIYNTSLFIEHGISNRWTATFNGVLFSRNYMNNIRSGTTRQLLVPGEALNSLGDIDLGIKYSLTQNSKFPLSLSLILGLPTGATGGGTQGNLQTGDGEFNQILQVDFGNGFKIGNNSSYVSGYLGINNRTQGYSEEFRYGLEFGIGLLNNKLWLNTKLNAIESFKNGNTAETVTSTSVFADNSEFVSIGVEANYYVTNNLGVSAGVASAVRGEIIAAAPAYSVGVFLDIK